MFAQGSTNAHVSFLFFIGVFLYINRDTVPIGPYPLLASLLLCAMALNTPGFQYAYLLLITTAFLAISFGSSFAWMSKIGDFSYGVYLYGWPVQQLVVFANPEISAYMNTVISIVISLMLGYLSWHIIEKRAMLQRNKIIQHITSILPFQTNKAQNSPHIP